MIKELLQKFIKHEVMKDATSLVQLLKIDVDQSSNHVKSSMVKFGFATEGLFCEPKENENLNEKQVFEFRMECNSFFCQDDKEPFRQVASELTSCIKKHDFPGCKILYFLY